jgi:predicted nucleotidyltransferase
MTLERLRQLHRETILTASARYGASNVRVFGSVARGESDELSDIDLLVDLDRSHTLMDLGGLQAELDRELRVHVDVATERLLRAKFRDRVLNEAVPL